MADFGKKGRDLEGNYIFFVGQHDRLQPDALLQIAGAYNRFMQKQEKAPELIYMDHDMLVGQDRMEPHFKPELNMELLRHCNYIGQHFLVSCSAAYALGEFRQQLSYACVYEYRSGWWKWGEQVFGFLCFYIMRECGKNYCGKRKKSGRNVLRQNTSLR